MVYNLIYEISINDTDITKIVGVEIDKTVNSFTNTAVITLPRWIKKDNEYIFTDFKSNFLKKGDKVSIKLGYQAGLNRLLDTKQFTGYVSNIVVNDESTVQIECQDEMYFLKHQKFNYSKKQQSLKELGNMLVNKLPVKLGFRTDIDLTLHKVMFENVTGVEILEHLLKEYSLKSFIKNGELVIGMNYNFTDLASSTEYTFSTFNKELIKSVTDKPSYFIIDKSDLQFQFEDEVNFKIEAKLFKPDGKVEKYSFGDEAGDKRTFVFYGDYSASEVKKLVDNQVQRIKYTGFKQGSSFSTFGKPDIDLLDIVTFDGIGNIKFDNQITYPISSYIVEANKISFDNNGFRQNITISNKISMQYSGTITEKVNAKIVALDK